ncbi:MAG: transposase, partial [Sphingobacteriales bacterium]
GGIGALIIRIWIDNADIALRTPIAIKRAFDLPTLAVIPPIRVKPGEEKIIPAKQKSRGVLLMTAALELSSNQITHFYSPEKNTEEMIKLVHILIEQYQGASRLYLSWDAARWHTSKKLKAELERLNSSQYRDLNKNPLIELAPLPNSAQFLNVIESIFSGMAKSVIHHSDYKDVEECKDALDIYVKQRNQHFLENPHRAGKYLWGAETVKTQFNEANNCRRPSGSS